MSQHVKSVVTNSTNVKPVNQDLVNLKARLAEQSIARSAAEATATAAKIANKAAKAALLVVNTRIETEAAADMALYFTEVTRLKSVADIAIAELKAFATPEEFKAYRLTISPRKARVASGKPRAKRGSLKALKALNS